MDCRNPYVVNMLPNETFVVNPLPTPLPYEVNLINNWFLKDVTGDGAVFPVSDINRSSLLLPPLYNFKLAFPS